MYNSSIPYLVKMLQNLSTILKKAEQHSHSKKIDERVFLEARLAPDMFNLVKQIQILTDVVRHGCGRIADKSLLRFKDNEKSFKELQTRIQKTIKYLNEIDPEKFNYTEEKEIKFTVGKYKMKFKGHYYLYSWIVQNFYFHVVTAYNILRHHGVALGKRDYLGAK